MNRIKELEELFFAQYGIKPKIYKGDFVFNKDYTIKEYKVKIGDYLLKEELAGNLTQRVILTYKDKREVFDRFIDAERKVVKLLKE